MQVPSTFLRFDRPELDGGRLVVRTVSTDVREHRRFSPGSPLAYLYERVSALEPESDESFDAGHYDEANLVWSFSGEVSGVVGLTEPTSSTDGDAEKGDQNPPR